MIKTEKRKGKANWTCTNSQELEFPYRDAEKKYGIKQSTFLRNIDLLIERGFIDIIESGALLQICTKYGLSERWKKYETDEFEQKSRPKSFKKGYLKKRIL